MISLSNVKLFWADARKDGFKEIGSLDVPFKAEGCIHFQADIKIAFIKLGSIKIAFCFH